MRISRRYWCKLQQKFDSKSGSGKANWPGGLWANYLMQTDFNRKLYKSQVRFQEHRNMQCSTYLKILNSETIVVYTQIMAHLVNDPIWIGTHLQSICVSTVFLTVNWDGEVNTLFNLFQQNHCALENCIEFSGHQTKQWSDSLNNGVFFEFSPKQCWCY